MLHIVLVEPEIPQNTGNIVRTCAAVGATLHLIEPLGFRLDDRYLKRAGLDYWPLLDLQQHSGLVQFFDTYPEIPCFFITTKGCRTYSSVKYPETCGLVFGKETKGLPEELLLENSGKTLRVPMAQDARSLNLSNTVAILSYEVMRQHGFPGLVETGWLSRSI
jgi:tRNA (cytidine/uridine-2'-O-)-methyltransferase